MPRRALTVSELTRLRATGRGDPIALASSPARLVEHWDIAGSSAA
jgi:hypothetical protein